MIKFLFLGWLLSTSPRWDQVSPAQVRIFPEDSIPWTSINLGDIQGREHTRRLSEVPWMSKYWGGYSEDTIVRCSWDVIRIDDEDGEILQADWVEVCNTPEGQK